MGTNGTFLYVKFEESKDIYRTDERICRLHLEFQKGNCGKLGAGGMAEKWNPYQCGRSSEDRDSPLEGSRISLISGGGI